MIVFALTNVLAHGAVRIFTDDEHTWVSEAVAYGRNGQPAPYSLHSSFPDRSVVGAVYSPFLRVALAARRAADERKALRASELDASVLEPVVWVRFYLKGPIPDRVELTSTEPIFGIVPAARVSPRGGLAPAWVRMIARDLLYDDARDAEAASALIAAFRVWDVKPDCDFVMYWDGPSPDGGQIAIQTRGGIRREDVQAWRTWSW